MKRALVIAVLGVICWATSAAAAPLTKQNGRTPAFSQFTRRTFLAYGIALRRARRRGHARTYLRAAFERFEALGARPWADRAHVELRACGQTARRRVAGAPVEQLTPQEVQVARFVSRGLTNADVAAQLFLSRRTVDFHLRNVFTKLGIRSRTELVRLVVDTE